MPTKLTELEISSRAFIVPQPGITRRSDHLEDFADELPLFDDDVFEVPPDELLDDEPPAPLEPELADLPEDELLEPDALLPELLLFPPVDEPPLEPAAPAELDDLDPFPPLFDVEEPLFEPADFVEPADFAPPALPLLLDVDEPPLFEPPDFDEPDDFAPPALLLLPDVDEAPFEPADFAAPEDFEPAEPLLLLLEVDELPLFDAPDFVEVEDFAPPALPLFPFEEEFPLDEPDPLLDEPDVPIFATAFTVP